MRSINGVAAEQLTDRTEAMERWPSAGTHTFRARNSWVEGGRTRSMIADYDAGQVTHLRRRPFVVMSDQPETLLGGDAAPSPAEYLLHALAACLTTTLVYQAAARGVTLDEVHTRVEGTMNASGMMGAGGAGRGMVERVRISFDVKANARPQEIEELMLLAQRHSPTFDLLANPVEVKVDWSR